jgi:hypothetical protein
METKAFLIFTCSLLIMGLGPVIFFETVCPHAEEQQEISQARAFVWAGALTGEHTRKSAEIQKSRRLFNMWNGACKPLEQELKNMLSAPGSYKHIKTRYQDHDSYLRVILVFRAKNAAGVTIEQSISADVDLEGKLSNILWPEKYTLQ